MGRVNYSLVSILIIAFISIMAFYFSGWVGLLILIVATAIGLVPNIVDVSRSNSMACLLIPIILVNVM
jgi:putative membrane protein